jgi:hypothetical protein
MPGGLFNCRITPTGSRRTFYLRQPELKENVMKIVNEDRFQQIMLLINVCMWTGCFAQQCMLNQIQHCYVMKLFYACKLFFICLHVHACTCIHSAFYFTPLTLIPLRSKRSDSLFSSVAYQITLYIGSNRHDGAPGETMPAILDVYASCVKW